MSDKTSPYPVIFLDVDGVTCTLKMHLVYGDGAVLDKWDPLSCALIRKLCTDYDCSLVISSTWREVDEPGCFKYLKEHALIEYLHEDWKTPSFKTGIRGLEIGAWLANHLEITNYLIIDDDSDFLEYQKPNHIHIINSYDGFGAKEYLLAVERLKAFNMGNNKTQAIGDTDEKGEEVKEAECASGNSGEGTGTSFLCPTTSC